MALETPMFQKLQQKLQQERRHPDWHAEPDALPPPQDPPLEVLRHLSEADRMAALGVDLSQYPAVWERAEFEPIASRTDRSLLPPIARAFAAQMLRQAPDPVMLTHIVTTRCNYSCSFCSFADSLNAKTQELSLGEIESVYASLGRNLNVIVYSGGETTLNKNLPHIIESAYRNTPVQSVYIISNAWKPNLILEITHQVLQRCPDLHLTWSLSIEGPRPYNNRLRHTQTPGWDAWQNTVDTMAALKEIRKRYGYTRLDVQLCTVCTPENYPLLDDWYAWVRDVLKPDKWNLNLMRKSVQMAESDLGSFSERRQTPGLLPFEAKYLELTERVRRDVLNKKLQFLYHTGTPMEGALKSAVDLVSQEANRQTVLEQPAPFCCKAGTMGAYIGSEGEVSGCEEFAHNPTQAKLFGRLREVGLDFQKVWRSPQADEHRQQVNRAAECHGCTLESQKNYPAILVSFKSLVRAAGLAGKMV